VYAPPSISSACGIAGSSPSADSSSFAAPVVLLLEDQLARLLDGSEHLELVLRIGQRPRRIGPPRGHGPAQVAERGEPLLRLLVEIGRLRLGGFLAGLGHQPVEPLLHLVGDCRVARDHVRRLAGIGSEVVELRVRRLDQFVAGRAQRVERAPAELHVRRHRLGVRVGRAFVRRIQHLRQQRAALGAGGHVDAEEVEERGQQVDRAHLRGDTDALQALERGRQHEGHVERVVVHEVPVARLAVAAERLAVVAHHHDHGAVLEAVRFQPGQASPHLLVGEGDLSVVEPAQAASAESRAERLGRLVGRVRVVQMDPREEWAPLVGVEPRERRVHDLVARPLHGPEIQVLVLPEVEAVVVHVEPLVESPAAVEHERGDPRRRRVAALAERFGDGRLGRAQRGIPVDAHPVEGGVGAGQDRGVRGQRQRRRRRRLREEHAAPRQRVDSWGSRPRRSRTRPRDRRGSCPT
jgi:hypothetical protein